MARFVFQTATTANGFLADDDDSLEWLFAVPGEQPDAGELLDGVRVVVMGSTTYEWLVKQENLLEFPEKLAAFYPDIPVWVFSSRDLPLPQGADVRLVSGNVADYVDELAAIAGDERVWIMGGGDLVGQFLDANALDAIELTVAPAFLSSGRPLLPRELHGDRIRLREAFAVGQWVQIRYDIARRTDQV